MTHKDSDDTRCDLEEMVRFAQARSEYKVHLPPDCYVRVGGNGFRTVSVSHNTPLMGISPSPVKHIQKAYDHVEKYRPSRSDRTRPTPERVAQAWLIKQAINDDLNLKPYLGLIDVYEKLLFAVDEVSFGGEGRTDIVAVGVRGGSACPVLVELKPDRQLTRLIEQLDTYAQKVAEFKPQIQAILEACVERRVDCSCIGKMIVWPCAVGEPSPDILKECRKRSITVIESDVPDWNGQISFSFHPVGEVYSPVALGKDRK
ncbi:MAG: hypothetical protein ABW041_03805 [Dehalococcoides mccartyi]